MRRIVVVLVGSVGLCRVGTAQQGRPVPERKRRTP